MREYLFRGKRLSDGKWCEGYLTVVFEHTYIVRANEDEICFGFLVDPETVGQFTGLTDKKGKKIFEGDILLINDAKEYPVYVSFTDFCFVCRSTKHRWYRNPLENRMQKHYEVIGNIHDNPELLEVGKWTSLKCH